MKKWLLSSLAAMSLLLLLAVSVMAAPGGVTNPDALKELAAARQATIKYQDVNNALADGYVPLSPYIPSMGIHYVNIGLASDLVVDPLTPEILLYAPTQNGVRLVGVEYSVVYVGQPAPVLFGQPMDGPMPGHAPGEPDHYDLHVWLWQGNPDGIFAVFNPTLP